MVDNQGRELESSGHLYQARVTSYEIRGEIDDGIFEPNERIEVHKLCVKNVGGITMPSGSLLHFYSLDRTVTFDEATQVLPIDLAPGIPNQDVHVSNFLLLRVLLCDYPTLFRTNLRRPITDSLWTSSFGSRCGELVCLDVDEKI